MQSTASSARRDHRGVFLFLITALALLPAACHPTSLREVQRAPAPAPGPQYQFHYLTPDSIDVAKLLPAPPDAQSPDARAFEAQLTAQLKALAGPAAQAHALDDETDDLWKFARVLGPNFTRQRCPRIGAMLGKAVLDGDQFKNAAKSVHQRARPGEGATMPASAPSSPGGQHVNPEVWSYPSGSAVRAGIRARLLAAIAPESEIELLREAWCVCLSRVIRGAHFPSDVTAGLILGLAAADAMLNSPAMAADLAAAREEWSNLATPAAR